MEDVKIAIFFTLKPSFIVCCCHVFKHFALCTCVAAGELMSFQ